MPTEPQPNGEETDGGVTTGPSGPSGRRRRWIAPTLIVVGAFLILTLLVAISALEVKHDVEAGRVALVQGKSALLRGDTPGAERAVATAHAAFARAVDRSRAPWMRVAGGIPFLGDTPDTIAAVADAALRASDAAQALLSAVDRLPGGLGGLAPTSAGIPVDRIATLGAAVAAADRLTGAAVDELYAAGGLVFAPVAAARNEARDQLTQIHQELHSTSLILAGLPSFLGNDGPRRYFFGAANPAELRGTGGLIGAYSILTIDRGHMRFSAFAPVESLPLLKVSAVPAPSPEYAAAYNFFRRGNGYWLNANMTPDFPSAAEAILASYEAATHAHLDGVVVTDPFALQSMLHVTGPLTVPKLGVRITASRVVPLVANRAYSLFPTQAERKLVLGDVAEEIFSRFLKRGGKSISRLRQLVGALGRGHIQVWTSNTEMESGLADTGVGGAFRPAGTDVLGVIQNNASGTKLDYYQDRTISYDVRLGGGGTAQATLAVGLANHAPASGEPRIVIGPARGAGAGPGENIALLDMYCGKGCVMQGVTVNGSTQTLGSYREVGFPFYQARVRIPPGATSALQAGLVLPNAWEGTSSGGTYRLSFVNQTTIRPTSVHVTIAIPDGMRVTSSSPELRPVGGLLVYDGTPAGDVEFQVSFAPPLVVRWWRDALRALP